jgi:proteasome lid subunit RPN8/RPN11
MTEIEYRYAVDYFSETGARLASLPVEPDWGPARECAHFLAIRRGIVPPLLRDGSGRIEPVWDPEHGSPVLGAARIVVAADTGDQTVSEEVPSPAYFRQQAQEGATTLVDRGLLERGERYRYRVCAYPCGLAGVNAEVSPPDAFQVEVVEERLPLKTQRIERFLARATAEGAGADPADMRVFIPQQVMDATVEASRQAGDVETGGVLVGHLHRCAGSSEIFLEVTAQIPAAHTDAQAARLTFTPETWTAAQTALELRSLGEILCGWWHKHPDFCRDCPQENRRGCLLSRPFFSSEDIHMHRTVFPRAFHVALLVSDHGRDSLDLNLFGWRHGLVEPRGFDVIGGEPETAASDGERPDDAARREGRW